MAEKLFLVLSTDYLDRVCPAFTLANAAAASGMEVSILFTCWGLNLVKRPGARPRGEGPLAWMMSRLSVRGPDRLPISRHNLLGIGGWMMRRRMRAKGVQSIPEMMADARELGCASWSAITPWPSWACATRTSSTRWRPWLGPPPT